MEEFYPMILGIEATVIGVLLAIVGFFLVRIIADVKNNTLNIGKNKGKIELVEQQQLNDVRRIEETTQLEIQKLGKEINNLATLVSTQSENTNNLISILTKQAKK